MIEYCVQLSKGKIVLWCYLIWYLVSVYFYFDPSIYIWLNSIGISVVIGVALMLSVSGTKGAKMDHWQTFRLFLMPFCVSSFSSLIKGKGFIFIIPPHPLEQMIAVTSCLIFIVIVMMVKGLAKKALA
jgi:hypothetical protein